MKRSASVFVTLFCYCFTFLQIKAFFLFVLIVLTIPSQLKAVAHPEEKTANSSNQEKKASQFVVCRLQKEVRSLRLLRVPSGCELIYSKAGKDEKIAYGQNILGCQQILEQVQKKLENGNFQCRKINEARILDINSEEKPRTSNQ